jgi:hypothetical protein
MKEGEDQKRCAMKMLVHGTANAREDLSLFSVLMRGIECVKKLSERD